MSQIKERGRNEKFRILSLDGGGTRGFLSANILKNIEDYLIRRDKVDRPLGEHFDLIAGTSTGGIIALALAVGMTAKDVAQFYEENIPQIFSPVSPWKKLVQLRRPIYESDQLASCLNKFFGERTMSDVKTDVCITSVALQNARPRLYKSDYLARNAGRLDEKLVDIAMATSAAPVYFKAHSLKYSTNLVDGGLCANNPAMVALVEAFQFERSTKRGTEKATSFNDIVLLSIGTGEQCGMPYDVDSVKDGGVWQWMKIPQSPVLEVVFQSQSQLVHFQAHFLVNNQSYLRINPLLKFPMSLDDTRRIAELKNLADLTRDTENFINTHF